MPALLTPRLRSAFVSTLLVAASIAMSVVLYRIWQVQREVSAIAGTLTLDYGPQTTLIHDSKDRVISALYREHRLPVMLEQMSEPLQQAVLAAEDRRFYEHNGVDHRRVAAAMIANIRRGRIVQGASTITQQFVRSAALDRSRTFGRKIREAWLAHHLEEKFGKRAILQAYLNHVYFGDGYYGAQAASLGYFGKPASEITAVEGATLAALINRPSSWTIRKTPSRIRDRRDWVLREMYAAGYLDATTFGSAIATPVAATLANDGRRAEVDPVVACTAPYFSSLVHDLLFEQFGVDRALTGGLRVYTTLDTDVQRFAETSVAKRLAELDKKPAAAAAAKLGGGPLQAALVAIEPSTGYVRALVGGRNFAESPYNRATDAKRQPGSAFKPFVFAAALEAGFSPGTTIDGLDGFVPSPQGGYLPGGEHEVEATTLRSALVHSSNRAAVHLLQRVGLGATLDLANRVGLRAMPAVPSLALGTGEVSLLNLTSAYTAFANGGVLQPPVFVTRIEDPDGRVIYRGESLGRRVLSESTAYLMATMLADVVNHGTGYGARQSGFRLPAAGKTGSTDDHADAWFVGFTPRLAAGVWVGFDQPQQIMRRGFASVVAVPAWAGFMKAATTGNKAEWLERPAGVTRIRRCRESGGLATEYCELTGEVDDDHVSIGRGPDICTLHNSMSIMPPPTAPIGSISYTIRRPQQ
ncbi:MAG TPA: PBP1A family penicillin-binding protein [Vicinamibacterales bacterium]|nr:PBP1A family penicillin-binding protein [Vicinamibacterales bacterium]